MQNQQRFKEKEKDVITDEFVSDHMSMVESIASNIMGSGKVPPSIDFGDLTSWGTVGLIKAKRNFKEDKGSKFKTYAYYRIRGEILDKIRSEWQYRNPVEHERHRQRVKERIAEAAEGSIDHGDPDAVQKQVRTMIQQSAMVYMVSTEEVDIVSDKAGTKNPEVELIDQTDSVLWEEISTLSEDERKIVDLFYVKGLKQVEIALEMNYSKSKVCRLHMGVLGKLRKRLHRRYDE